MDPLSDNNLNSDISDNLKLHENNLKKPSENLKKISDNLKQHENQVPNNLKPSENLNQAPEIQNLKIRLLCRYGGHIIPKPNTNTLTYSGGDTKIVSLSLSSLSLQSLTSHLSRTLRVSRFLIKYQLPGEDLDSLITVGNDEDLKNMIEEYERVVEPKRIRVFLFPARTESVGVGFKSESWFCDALQGAGLIRRGVSDSGMDLGGGDIVGGRSESMVMETGSSFGSTGSSVSMTNLPPIGGPGEDNGVFEKRRQLPSSGSIESDNNTPSAISQQYTATYQDPNVHLTSAEAMARPTVVESANVYQNLASSFQTTLKTVQAGAYQASNQIHHQQEVQYVPAGSHYIPQYSATPSYYPMYYPPLNQPTHSPYQQNQPYPVYYVPVRPTEPYNAPTQYNLVDNSGAVLPPSHPQMHPPVPKEVVSASTPPQNQVPSNQSQQQLVDISDVNPTTQPATTQPAVNTEFDDEFVYAQIYKTQPSGPTLISQYQTMASGDTIK